MYNTEKETEIYLNFLREITVQERIAFENIQDMLNMVRNDIENKAKVNMPHIKFCINLQLERLDNEY